MAFCLKLGASTANCERTMKRAIKTPGVMLSLLATLWATGCLAETTLSQQHEKRCEWGQRYASQVEARHAEGVSYRQAVTQVDGMGYAAAWKSRMAYAITDWVYGRRVGTGPAHPERDYSSRCTAYYQQKQGVFAPRGPTSADPEPVLEYLPGVVMVHSR